MDFLNSFNKKYLFDAKPSWFVVSLRVYNQGRIDQVQIDLSKIIPRTSMNGTYIKWTERDHIRCKWQGTDGEWTDRADAGFK